MDAHVSSRRSRRPVDEFDSPALHRTASATQGTARSTYSSVRWPERDSSLGPVHSSLRPFYRRHTVRLLRLSFRFENELRSCATAVVIRYLGLRAIRKLRFIFEV
jgi:hypothetical protein